MSVKWEVLEYVAHDVDPKGWRYHPAIMPEPQQAVAWDALAENVLYLSRMWHTEGMIAYDFAHDLGQTIIDNLGLTTPQYKYQIEAWLVDKALYVTYSSQDKYDPERLGWTKTCYMLCFDCREMENPVIILQQNLSQVVSFQPEYHYFQKAQA